VLQDVHLAFRSLVRRPGLSVAVIATLTVAVGAATAIFSLVHALILRPLPFPDADRLVTIEAVVNADEGRLSLREYRDLARDSRMFESWAAYYRSQYNLTSGGPPEALTCTIGTSTLFDVLDVRPTHGDVWPASQDFTRQYQVVLSHRLWRQRFGGRRDAVGSTIVMDGGSYQIMGVLPEGFDYPLQTDVFRAATDYNAPHVRRYSALARLKADVTLEQAQSELNGFSERFAQTYPDTNAGIVLRAIPLRDAYVGRARPYLWMLLGAVGLLLMIACVNVTNLLLSRAIAASGDFAVRLAMGAGRRHLVRQALTEALLLAIAGTICGGAGAWWGLKGLTAMVQADLPLWFEVEFDIAVLLFAATVAVITAIAVAALPAIQASRTDLERVLRQESSRSAGSRSQQLARRLLLAGQAAFATILLVAAGLSAGALRELLRIDTGFDSRGVVTFRVDPPYGRYPDIATTSEFYRRAAESLALIPGVDAAGTNTFLPFSGLDVPSPRVAVEGWSTRRPEEEPFVNFQIVDPGYLRAMRIPVNRGRHFERTDEVRSIPVAVVSARAAQRFWPGEDPLGRRIRINWNQLGVSGGKNSDIWLTVVGVAGNVRFSGLDDDAGLDVYAPNTQLFAGDSYVVVRTRTDPDALRNQLRAAIDAVDRDQSFFDVHTMQTRVQRSIWQHRVATAVLTIFAVVALCLAVIGTYAVTAHAVASQRREIGIRLALGSRESHIGWLVMRRWLLPMALGIAVGMVGGAALASVLARVLGIVRVADLLVPATFPLVLAAAATLACYLPVRRAVRRVQLVDALRAD
jgi:putative ABC transport system permease protein